MKKTPKFFVDQKRAERKGYQINYITDVIRISFLMYSFSFHNGSCTNKNWPYFVILFVKRRALGHVSVPLKMREMAIKTLGDDSI